MKLKNRKGMDYCFPLGIIQDENGAVYYIDPFKSLFLSILFPIRIFFPVKLYKITDREEKKLAYGRYRGDIFSEIILFIPLFGVLIEIMLYKRLDNMEAIYKNINSPLTILFIILTIIGLICIMIRRHYLLKDLKIDIQNYALVKIKSNDKVTVHYIAIYACLLYIHIIPLFINSGIPNLLILLFYVFLVTISILILLDIVFKYDDLKFKIIKKSTIEGKKVKNYKQTIIKAFNKAIEERGMKESITQTPKKARWINKRKYWTNLITVSMDKWKTEYWIDLSICFRWKNNMKFVSLGWSILGNDHKLDRFCIEISEETTEEKIQEVANEIIDKYIKHNEINTPENLNKRIYIYKGKEIIPQGNFWEDFNKFVLNYIVGDYEKGKEYYNKAKAVAEERESTLGTIKPFLDIVDNPELVLKKIEEICEKNIDKV